MEAKLHDLEEQYDESLSHAVGDAELPDADEVIRDVEQLLHGRLAEDGRAEE
jgi:hypothetical protein